MNYRPLHPIDSGRLRWAREVQLLEAHRERTGRKTYLYRIGLYPSRAYSENENWLRTIENALRRLGGRPPGEA